MKREEVTAAVGKSISFRPYSLYKDALAYGQSQIPARSISAVVCEALECFLKAKGFRNSEQSLRLELLAMAETIGAAEALRILKEGSHRGSGSKSKHRRGE